MRRSPVNATHRKYATDGRVAPEADLFEQRQPAGDEGTDETEERPEVEDRPEADVSEQHQTVAEEQIVDRSTSHHSVNEADWLEQSIAEPVEEDHR
jgi:hypothetical protein